jgi:hypothetical protein
MDPNFSSAVTLPPSSHIGILFTGMFGSDNHTIIFATDKNFGLVDINRTDYMGTQQVAVQEKPQAL